MFEKLKEMVMKPIRWINNKVNIAYSYVKSKSMIVAEFTKKYFQFVKYVIGGAFLGMYYGVKDGYAIWKYGDDIVTHIDGLSDDLKDTDIDNLEPIVSEEADAVEVKESV